MSQQAEQTFELDGEEYPVTDEVVLTAVGLLDNFQNDITNIKVLGGGQLQLQMTNGTTPTKKESTVIELLLEKHPGQGREAIEATLTDSGIQPLNA